MRASAKLRSDFLQKHETKTIFELKVLGPDKRVFKLEGGLNSLMSDLKIINAF